MNNQIASIDVDMDEDDLLKTSIEGITTSWDTFLSTVNGRYDHPNFKIFWHDCIIEEESIQNKVVHTKVENLFITARTKKGRNSLTPKNSLRAKKKDINKGFEK